MIEVVGFTGAGDTLSALARLSNPSTQPACFRGYAEDSPLYSVGRWTGTEWQDPDPAGCGMGLTRVPLGAGKTADFTVPLGNDARPFRIVVSTTRPKEPRSVVRSARIDVPTALVIMTVDQINPLDRMRAKIEALRKSAAERRAHRD